MTDKKMAYLHFAAAALCAIPLLFFKPPGKQTIFKQDRANFRNGEVLLPDYVLSDTVVVIDADGLNYAIDSTDVGTDGEIDSVLDLYTIPFQK